MIKVSGLPVHVTKADLDELFSPYGTIQTAEDAVIIQVGEKESTAYLALDQNEARAIEELSNQLWRDTYLLYLDSERGDELIIGMRGSGGGRQSGGNQSGGNQSGGNQSGGKDKSDQKKRPSSNA